MILFDLGNVIFHIDISKFVNKYDEIMGSGGMRFLNRVQKMNDCGLMSREVELREDLLRKYEWYGENLDKLENVVKALLDAWNETAWLDERMGRMIELLKKYKVEIGFLSNIGFEHKKYIMGKWGWIFDGAATWFSCDIGARKPSRLYFNEWMLETGGMTAQLYFDDIDENLMIGKYTSNGIKKFALDGGMSLDDIKEDIKKACIGLIDYKGIKWRDGTAIRNSKEYEKFCKELDLL